MYKKLLFLFLLLFPSDTKPLGIVEFCVSFLSIAVGAKVLHTEIPRILEKIGYQKVPAMPIDVPAKVVNKNYSLAATKESIKGVVVRMQLRALALKKNLFNAVEQKIDHTSIHSAASTSESFSENKTQGSIPFSFTQAQQNNFFSRGFFPRTYITTESSDSGKHARSRYRWQGAFLGSIFTVVSLKTVDSVFGKKQSN